MAQIFVLDATTKTIRLSMVAAPTTANPEFVVAYADTNGTVFTEGATDGVLNGTTDVIAVSAPAAGFRRIIKSFSIYNKDTATATINIKLDNNGVQRVITRTPLSVNETFTLDGVYDNAGNLKTSNSRGEPYLASVTGIIWKGTTNTITLSGGNFVPAPAIVRFRFGATTIDDPEVLSSTVTHTLTVPTAVSDLAGGSTGTVQLIDVYGRQSNQLAITVADATLGGTITQTGNVRVHSYTTSGTFTTTANITVTCMVVAGGGGGGNDMGGGGGGGGYLANSFLSVPAGTYTVTVGGGGSGAPATNGGTRGSNGGNSVFHTLTAIGGGGGASGHRSDTTPAVSAGVGGSGGGSSGRNNNYALGTAGQGNAGGPSNGEWYSGSGGGSAAAGSATPGAGGAGTENNILGTSYYWAAGGGGSGYSSNGGAGGIGGGGGGAGPSGGAAGGSALNPAMAGQSGQTSTIGGAAGTNTGSGGGGGAHFNSNNNGGNGGSGIVVIRVALG